MRILHAILSQGFYGSERYCIELAIAQADAGHAVAIVLQGAASDCAQQFQQQIDSAGFRMEGRDVGVPSLVVIPEWLPTWLYRPVSLRVIRRFAPDIVHTHLNPAARRIGSVAQWLGMPHIATLHISYDVREHARCDGLIAIASWQKARLPVEVRDKVAVISPWLPSNVRKALSNATLDEVNALRQKWRAGEAVSVFGSVGRLAPEKGMDVLVDAFRAAFPSGDEPVRLVIVGEGPQRSLLQKLVGRDSRIVLAGPQANVAHYYRAFDVLVSAARFEPFGMAILEAMAAGLRIIVTKTDGPREFLTDNRILWVETEDEGALSAKLKETAALGRGRLQYELASFSRERAAQAIERFYHDVVERRSLHGHLSQTHHAAKTDTGTP